MIKIFKYINKKLRNLSNYKINDNDFYDLKECSEITGITLRTLQRRAKEMKLKTINNKYFLNSNQLKYLLNYNKNKLKKHSLHNINNIEDKTFTKTYLIKNKRNGFYKIGKSKRPFKREKTLQSQEPLIEIIKVFNKDVESELHKLYSEFRIRGEWFDLSKIQVKYICNKFN